jgi:hypothetical protein
MRPLADRHQDNTIGGNLQPGKVRDNTERKLTNTSLYNAKYQSQLSLICGSPFVKKKKKKKKQFTCPRENRKVVAH